jgi:hypothetical protein
LHEPDDIRREFLACAFFAIIPSGAGKLCAFLAAKKERLRRTHCGVLIAFYLSEDLGAVLLMQALPTRSLTLEQRHIPLHPLAGHFDLLVILLAAQSHYENRNLVVHFAHAPFD